MKNRKAIYSVLSFAAVIVPIALDSALRHVRVYYARDPKAVLLSALFAIAILSCNYFHIALCKDKLAERGSGPF